MTRAKILLAICGLFFLLNCGDGDLAACRRCGLFQLNGASNFRDFGGYPTASGKTGQMVTTLSFLISF